MAPSSDPISLGAERATQLRVPGFLVSDLRFAAGRVLDPHAHERTTVAVVVQGGFDGWWDGHEAPCPPGTLVTEPLGERHANRFAARKATRIAIVQPDGDRLDLRPARARRAVPRPDLVPLADRLLAELRWRDEVTPLAVEGMALELAAIAARRSGPRGGKAWVRRIAAVVEDRHAEPLTLGLLAAEVGMHPAHVARAFRAHSGRSVGTYLREVRVRRAADRLERTDDPIAEIAFAVGFADQSHLNRWFGRYVGVTPARYRDIVRAPRG